MSKKKTPDDVRKSIIKITVPHAVKTQIGLAAHIKGVSVQRFALDLLLREADSVVAKFKKES